MKKITVLGSVIFLFVTSHSIADNSIVQSNKVLQNGSHIILLSDNGQPFHFEKMKEDKPPHAQKTKNTLGTKHAKHEKHKHYKFQANSHSHGHSNHQKKLLVQKF